MITRERARQLRRLIELGAEALSDEDALEGVELQAAWEPDADYAAGKRLQHEGRLWRVRQALHSQAIYPPGSAGTEALYEEVTLPGDGESRDRPISYGRNMALELGKYYVDAVSGDGVVYLCTRDSGIPMTHPLAELVGLYVEVA